MSHTLTIWLHPDFSRGVESKEFTKINHALHILWKKCILQVGEECRIVLWINGVSTLFIHKIGKKRYFHKSSFEKEYLGYTDEKANHSWMRLSNKWNVSSKDLKPKRTEIVGEKIENVIIEEIDKLLLPLPDSIEPSLAKRKKSSEYWSDDTKKN